MKKLMPRLVCACNTLLLKLVSFKNLISIMGTILGVHMAKVLNANFLHWMYYQLGIFVLFFASNQLQKLIISKIPSFHGFGYNYFSQSNEMDNNPSIDEGA